MNIYEYIIHIYIIYHIYLVRQKVLLHDLVIWLSRKTNHYVQTRRLHFGSWQLVT